MTEAGMTALAGCLGLSVTQTKEGWEALAMA